MTTDVLRAVAQSEDGTIEFDPERMVIGRPYWLTWRGHLAYLVRHATHIALYPAEGEDARHVAPVENGEPATSAETLAQQSTPRRASRFVEISTRRVEDGVVHEMAEFGTGTICEKDLREPWEWTNEGVNCERCLAVMMLEASAKAAEEGADHGRHRRDRPAPPRELRRRAEEPGSGEGPNGGWNIDGW